MSDSTRKKGFVALGAGLVFVIVATALVTWLLTGSGDGGQELLLQPLADSGPDPFTASVATADAGQLQAFADARRDPTAAESDGVVVKTVDGGEAGLYGGSTAPLCNVEALSESLTSDPDKAAAWAGVQGISPDEIDEFLASLAPAVLPYDTLVTNHGIRNGSAHAFQAVLQAGTPVLVDAYGVPRARCACGNPLLAPSSDLSEVRVTGTKWTGYRDTTLRLVQPTPAPLPSLELIDIVTNQPITVPVGGGGAGFGEYLVFTKTGLDVADANGSTRPLLTDPVRDAFDDGRGGLLFSYGYTDAGGPTATDGSLYWLKAGATEPEAIHESSGGDRERFDVKGVGVDDAGTWVFFDHSVPSGVTDDVTHTLVARNLDTGEERTLYESSGSDFSYENVSMNDHGVLFTHGAAGCVRPELRDASWNEVPLRWAEGQGCGGPCPTVTGLACGGAIALDQEGNIRTLSINWTRPNQVVLSEVDIVDPEGFPIERLPIERSFAGAPGLEIDGTTAYIADTTYTPLSSDSTPTPAAVRLDLTTEPYVGGGVEELPVKGRIRHLQAPLRLPILSAAAESTTPTTPTTGSEPAGDAITSDWLMNALLPRDACGDAMSEFAPLELVNGAVPGIPEVNGSITTSPAQNAIADLDGDGVADGVLRVTCWYGGTFAQDVVYVYRAASPDAPALVEFPTGASQGDGMWGPAVDQMTVDRDTLRVTWSVWLRDDVHAMPSSSVLATYDVSEDGVTVASYDTAGG